ncbi:phage tail length tape measure family protein, partial [Escherichia coli]
MTEQVGSLQIDIDLRTKNLLVSQRQAESALDDIGDAISKAESKTKTLNTQLTKTSRAVGSSLKGAFQQAGYQIQDFVVQVQSGQNALVALSQQGSQLLSAFGGWGIALGAALTVGVSLFNSLK